MLTSATSADDVLSATLAKMQLKALNSTTIDAGGRWAFELRAAPVLRLQVVLRGECWIVFEDDRRTHHLVAGDCFLLPHAKRLVMASDLAIKKRQPLERVIRSAEAGVMQLVCNDGGDFLSVGTAFQLEGHFQSIVFGRLPPLIHIPAHADQAAVLRWGLERFTSEVQSAQPGRALMLSHLAPIMLLQTFRSYLASAANERNWFVALSEPRLARALAAMQSDHARSWSLDDLAKTAGLSRAGFALNFKKWIGLPPLEYLTQWRVQLACELLKDSDRRLTEVANSVGYESESAFSAAFTRIVGTRPGQYRRRLATT